MGTLEIRSSRIIIFVLAALALFARSVLAEPAYRIWYSANNGGPNWRILSGRMDENNKVSERTIAIDLGPVGSLDSAHAYSCAVVKDTQALSMWYAGFDGANWRILRATSYDGAKWIKQGMALALGGENEFDSVYMTYPYVLMDDGLYKMWYTAFDGKTHWRIGYAESKDGIIFKNRKIALDIGPASSLDCEHVHTPVVIKHGGIYTMFYAGFGGYPRGWRILRATSTDGLSWTKQGLVLDLGEAGSFDSTNLLPGSVIYSDGIFKMWYWAHGSNWRIMYATSKNAIDWEKKGLAIDLGEAGSLDAKGLVVPVVVSDNGKASE